MQATIFTLKNYFKSSFRLLIDISFHLQLTLSKVPIFKTLNSQFNRPALYQLGYDHRVAIRPLTHASIIWKRREYE